MLITTKQMMAVALLAPALVFSSTAWADNPHVLTVMTRNMDAGTDLNYILAATDFDSLMAGTAATLAEVKAAEIPERAARLAGEIAACKPDLVALQEVTLWRTGPLMQPPATEVLYDQLDLLMAELAKRKLHYRILGVQSLLDAEAPVLSANVDLRMTDQNVMLARTDLPASQFRIVNVDSGEYLARFSFGSPLLGEFVEPAGWMYADVKVLNSVVRFVNTHLESAGVPGGADIQLAQTDELLAAIASPGMPVVLAGDFNSNAEPGPESTGAAQKIAASGFLDCWSALNPGNPGYTWPLFGEDQLSGPANPNERIDLVFASGTDRDLTLQSVERTGAAPPYASDHAGVVAKIRLR